MPLAAIARPDDIDLLQLTTALAAIAAGVLWFAVYVVTANAPELCSATPLRLDHCGLCYPAALATLAALVGVSLQLGRPRKA